MTSRATRPFSPRSSMIRSMRGDRSACSATFDELDLVAVGILDEGDDGGAELHRARRPRDLDAGLAQLLAGRIDIGHADREMAEGGADRIRLLLIPVIGELDHRIGRLVAIADKGEGVAAFRDFALAQHLHAEEPRIEIERLLEVEYAQHGVQHARLDGVCRIHGLSSDDPQLAPARTAPRRSAMTLST